MPVKSLATTWHAPAATGGCDPLLPSTETHTELYPNCNPGVAQLTDDVVAQAHRDARVLLEPLQGAVEACLVRGLQHKVCHKVVDEETQHLRNSHMHQTHHHQQQHACGGHVRHAGSTAARLALLPAARWGPLTVKAAMMTTM